MIYVGKTVRDRDELKRVLAEFPEHPHYVYILKRPASIGLLPEPFYVGIGQGERVFSHETEAQDKRRESAKVAAIRAIWKAGQQVIREIDSVHESEPWDHEEGLINSIGRLQNGGSLSNAQIYAPSNKVDGVELRKYAKDLRTNCGIDEIPAKFKLRDTHLMAGPNEPRSRTSVFGKIYTLLEEHPGVTGEELVKLLSQLDFSGNKSAYTQSGKVSASWLVGYIEGGYFRADRRHLQDYRA